MKTLWTLGLICFLGACSFNEKQPVNSEYYKNTQGIAWPENKDTTAKVQTKTATAIKKVADKTAETATMVADKATTVSKTITTTVSETTTYTK